MYYTSSLAAYQDRIMRAERHGWLMTYTLRGVAFLRRRDRSSHRWLWIWISR